MPFITEIRDIYHTSHASIYLILPLSGRIERGGNAHTHEACSHRRVCSMPILRLVFEGIDGRTNVSSRKYSSPGKIVYIMQTLKHFLALRKTNPFNRKSKHHFEHSFASKAEPFVSIKILTAVVLHNRYSENFWPQSSTVVIPSIYRRLFYQLRQLKSTKSLKKSSSKLL